MSKRNKIIIAIIAVVVVILLIIIIALFLNQRRSARLVNINTNQAGQLPANQPASTAGLNKSQESPVKEKKLEASLKAIASTFAERFGSYSNEGNYSNLEALKDLMTDRMKAWAQSYQASQQKPSTNDSIVYYGITTQALSVQISNFDQAVGTAEAIVVTQRQETKNNTTNPKVYYQNLKLQLLKTAAGWKVDAAEWQQP
ncbi:MAG: hypothetical protein WC508_02245 [Patescibacteria group bacterium]